MRISDWSSDVCSSDLIGRGAEIERPGVPYHQAAAVVVADVPAEAVEAGTAVPGPRQAGHHMRQPRRHPRGGVDHRLALEASGAALPPQEARHVEYRAAGPAGRRLRVGVRLVRGPPAPGHQSEGRPVWKEGVSSWISRW